MLSSPQVHLDILSIIITNRIREMGQTWQSIIPTGHTHNAQLMPRWQVTMTLVPHTPAVLPTGLSVRGLVNSHHQPHKPTWLKSWSAIQRPGGYWHYSSLNWGAAIGPFHYPGRNFAGEREQRDTPISSAQSSVHIFLKGKRVSRDSLTLSRSFLAFHGKSNPHFIAPSLLQWWNVFFSFNIPVNQSECCG